MTAASQYYKVTSRVGVPHRNSVEVTIPLIGPVGPAGPQGEQGPPGEVSGSIAWDNVSGKPSTFPPSTHTHVAANITDFSAAVAAVSPPVDWNSLTGKPATFAPSAHTHPTSDITNFASEAASAAPVQSVAGRTGTVTLAKADVGLGNVDNTSDANKPVSTATQSALDGKAATSHTHTASQVTDFNAAAAAAAPVQSVNGNTGAVTVTVPTASSTAPSALGVAAAGTSSNFARADHVHAMPSAADVGAAWAQTVTTLSLDNTPQTASAGRNQLFRVTLTSGLGGTLILPTSSPQEGDLFAARLEATTGSAALVVRNSTFSLLRSLGSTAIGRTLLFQYAGGAWIETGASGSTPVAHTHAAADITSGTLDIARIPTGTGSTQVALGDHSHGNLSSDGKLGSTAGLPVVTTTAGAVTTLALGTANQVLRVNSGASGVEFADPAASGVTGAASSASDVLGVSGSDITGVDANADRIVFWDDSADKLAYLEVSTGLSLSGTTLTATASGGSKTYAAFTATDNQPPATAFATLDTRNSIAVLDFDDATTKSAVFAGIMPEGASLGSGLIVRIHFMGTTATSGDVRWSVAFERGNTDLDSDSFDTATAATVATSSTAGIPAVAAITCTNIDGITAGDMFRLRVQRIGGDGADTASGDMELVVCEVRSAA